jgi:hypothetical protein
MEQKTKLKKHKDPRVILFFGFIITALALVAFAFWIGLIEFAEYLSEYL